MAPARRHQLRIAAWYAKIAAFKVEDLFSRKKEPGPPRTIFVNENLPETHFDARGKVKPEHVYATNQVITSKYTFITFLPRNLLEQFRRVANMYVRLSHFVLGRAHTTWPARHLQSISYCRSFYFSVTCARVLFAISRIDTMSLDSSWASQFFNSSPNSPQYLPVS